ncbi:hypothetical protein B0H10DRAFT_1957950 [Mycena sp. CBHHK59/15]|nr:hypothetical protein B0H10DRAFT_1957950 [Mycena sp. CBHHK59/15]
MSIDLAPLSPHWTSGNRNFLLFLADTSALTTSILSSELKVSRLADVPPLPSCPKEMSHCSLRQLVHEFAICASLSFVIILGVLHALPHVLHICYLSDLAQASSPLAGFWIPPVIRITEAHTSLLTVFKVTVACTILVFAAREIISELGWHLGFRDDPVESDSAECGGQGSESMGYGVAVATRREEKRMWSKFAPHSQPDLTMDVPSVALY